ncbi:MAG: TlyA family RNA methyltransferase [Acholeplasmatales bacterium]|nr:MAG: TlyA family RNA methyltransferase [Acholeplasmatales bacterium]
MRLDMWLIEKGYFSSRARAQREIREGRIRVNDRVITKPAHTLSTTDVIETMTPFNPYVGVGGLKLAAALKAFAIDVKGQTILDVGASTGGFTDCVLKHGAAHVVAVDVGRDQMVPQLVEDPRVALHESTHFLDTDASFFADVDVLVMDVSFIPALTLIAHATKYYHGPMVVLFKPQYASIETPKRGVVRDKRQHVRLLEQFEQGLKTLKLTLQKLMPSPIKGGSGNIEFLCLINETGPSSVDIHETVEQAHATYQ